ncbi:MAG TPA: RNA polymerase sigma-70 factor [Arenibacter sp.]|nr:RNA polymerase sigma-70 factor [Arenibacter sp.]
MNEIEAVIALKNGDQSAFKFLFQTYYDRLMAYIITYTHDKMQAEDIVQHAFIRLWKKRHKLDETRSPKSYLYAIAHNRYIDTVNDKKKQDKIIDRIWERALIDRIEDDTDAMESRIQKMKQVIDSLPAKCREIIVLNKTQGLKYKEIAEQMGISVKTVESQMRIAFIKIREAFKKDDLLLFLLLG